MAIMGPLTTCPHCLTEFRPINNVLGCPECKREAMEKREADHFAELDKLTVEERIRRIEKWMFHYSIINDKPKRY